MVEALRSCASALWRLTKLTPANGPSIYHPQTMGASQFNPNIWNVLWNYFLDPRPSCRSNTAALLLDRLFKGVIDELSEFPKHPEA